MKIKFRLYNKVYKLLWKRTKALGWIISYQVTYANENQNRKWVSKCIQSGLTIMKIILIYINHEEIHFRLIKRFSINSYIVYSDSSASLTKFWSDTYYSKLKIFSTVGYCVWKVESIEELYYFFWWPTLALHEIFTWWDLCSLQLLFSLLVLCIYDKFVI